MFTMRQKIFIISGIVVAVILIVVLSLIYIKPKNNNTTNTTSTTVIIDENIIDSNNPNIILNPINNQNNQIISKPDGTPEELFVKQMARIFVERFFTYSNQNKNINIEELKDSVTASMLTWMNSQAPEASVQYSGVTTHVISSSLSDFNKNIGTAKVTIDAEQLISKDVNGIFEQIKEQKKFEIDFQLVGVDWKVSGVWDRT
ncbi:MAG: hypothetical protein COY69_01320 [Candidatus Magasanikbacteria bacterium CG_4_10_14_0_8_um_filter_32_14]|uniref:Tim44-like domain-containing protein n=2 Tax=Candidatus Magasanikiibacteriota TaxID=1752731 RepID=A0A2M7R9R0_9BACT|nr:MAG: hypothetical protein AUJ23_01640 [Candidatus Magasanikbacteria bacterium CG1_02_32_51]PIY93495.1 MAG: hypothetical protein COY69_01320 [Candidatus Magasanikbacteria bacterium CG_4_10_14_0_8_um_filter_32_14]